MYHNSFRVSIYSREYQLEELLKTVPPISQFEYDFHTYSGWDIHGQNESAVILWDLPHPEKILEWLCKLDEEKRPMFILCAEEKGLAELYRKYYDEIYRLWPKPLEPNFVQLQWKKLQAGWKQQAEDELNRNYLDTLIDTIPDLIWFKDARGAHLKVNNSFCQFVGKTKEQVQGRGHYYIWDLDPDEYAKGEYVCMETEEIVLQEKKTFLFNENVKCGDEFRQFKTYKSPILDRNGNAMGTVGIARDVTNMKNIQMELSVIIENMPFGVLLTNKEQIIVDTNRCYLELFSVAREQTIGCTIAQQWEQFERESVIAGWKLENQEGKLYLFGKQMIIRIEEVEIKDVFGQLFGYLYIYNDETLEYCYRTKLIESANVDYLTGLNNRRSLNNFLKKNSTKDKISLLLADLDNFKLVNDQCGHHAGDQVLVAFSNILRNHFPSENVFRLGGDEFLIAILEEQQYHDIENSIRAITEEFRSYINEELQHPDVSVSIGVARKIDGATDFSQLIKSADKAMYQIKNYKKQDGTEKYSRNSKRAN